MLILSLLLNLSITILTIYFVIKSVNFRKFLTGAFLVSGGIQLYLAWANVSIPLLGTNIIQNPEVGFKRGIFHLLLCAVCFYFGFIKKSNIK